MHKKQAHVKTVRYGGGGGGGGGSSAAALGSGVIQFGAPVGSGPVVVG